MNRFVLHFLPLFIFALSASGSQPAQIKEVTYLPYYFGLVDPEAVMAQELARNQQNLKTENAAQAGTQIKGKRNAGILADTGAQEPPEKKKVGENTQNGRYVRPKQPKKQIDILNQMQCDQCEEVLITLKVWNNHRAKNHNIMPYDCEFCDQGFKTIFEISEHYKTHDKRFSSEKKRKKDLDLIAKHSVEALQAKERNKATSTVASGVGASTVAVAAGNAGALDGTALASKNNHSAQHIECPACGIEQAIRDLGFFEQAPINAPHTCAKQKAASLASASASASYARATAAAAASAYFQAESADSSAVNRAVQAKKDAEKAKEAEENAKKTAQKELDELETAAKASGFDPLSLLADLKDDETTSSAAASVVHAPPVSKDTADDHQQQGLFQFEQFSPSARTMREYLAESASQSEPLQATAASSAVLVETVQGDYVAEDFTIGDLNSRMGAQGTENGAHKTVDELLLEDVNNPIE